jgi:predicted PurR-regulated permease PerM
MHTSILQKTNSVFFFCFALLLLFYLGADLLIPLTFAAFLTALVAPICSMLEAKTFLGRIPAALLSTLLVLLVIGGLAYMMVYQLSIFANDLPQIRDEFKNFWEDLRVRISNASGISQRQQQQFLEERSETFLNTMEQQLTNFLGNLFMVTLKFMLVLIYVFLFLLSRHKFKGFVLMYSSGDKSGDKEERSEEIIAKGSRVIYSYLWGRLKVIAALAGMYILAFWYFNVPYAILLTLFGAIITIIPYAGPLISGVLPVIFFMVFGREFSDVVIFASVVLVIQLIESYVLEPMIIGSEVDLSPLAVIIAILIGSMLWGLAGMILFVPIVAIVRIWSQHTPALRPLGYLLSNKNTTEELSARTNS